MQGILWIPPVSNMNIHDRIQGEGGAIPQILVTGVDEFRVELQFQLVIPHPLTDAHTRLGQHLTHDARGKGDKVLQDDLQHATVLLEVEVGVVGAE